MFSSKEEGFLIYVFGVLCIAVCIYIQVAAGTIIRPCMQAILLAVFVMIHGLYVMSGTKFRQPPQFWKNTVGGGYPVWFGAVIEFYIDIIIYAILCILIIIFVAPSVIQRLVVLTAGTSVICLLLYFRLKRREEMMRLIESSE